MSWGVSSALWGHKKLTIIVWKMDENSEFNENANFKQVGLWSLGQNGSIKVMKCQSMTISIMAVLMNIQFASW